MLIPKKVRLGLRLATEIVPRLPARGDNLLQVCVKILSLIDSTTNIMSPAKQNALDLLINQRGLVETKNEQFVSLFFDTNLYEQFNIRRYALTEYQDLIEASSPTFGDLLFIEYNYSNGGPESSFYHEKGMDFAEILRGMWDAYEGRLHVTIGSGQYGSGTSSEFASFNEIPNPLYGPMKDRMEALVKRHRRFAIDKVPRSYMFYGRAGTGKSSFALLFAERIGGRSLKMDAQSLSFAHVRDISFLISNLQPDFLIIDDVDKADTAKGLPTLLEILQRFKNEYTSTSLIMTSNTTDTFDDGFLRPGRVDTWEEFKLPEAEERRALITKYVDEFKSPASTEHLDELVKLTEGLSHDYLREVALELRYDEIDHVVKTVTLMHALLKAKADKAKAAVPGPPQTAGVPETKPYANGVS